MRCAIGLDVGSSSIKGGLLDLDALTIGATASRPFPAPLPGRPGSHEIDAEEVLTRCRAVIDDLAKGVEPKALLICGQHGGFVPFDPKTHRAIGPFISWRDERTGDRDADDAEGRSYFEILRATIGEELLQTVGRELAPGGTVAMVDWLRRHDALPAGVVPIGIGEYVLARLTDAEPVIERTCAVGMIDVRTMELPRELYERVGLADVAWPRIAQFHDVAGHTKIGGRDVPTYPVVGDHQCALAGALLAERELSINVSTGSQVSMLSRVAQPSSSYQIRCHFDGLLLNTSTHLPAGRALNVFVDLLCELPARAGKTLDDPWAILAPLINAVTDTDLRVKTTLFKGPLGERGAIENISVNNLTAGALMHAALIDMAANYRKAASWVAGDDAWDRLALSGGLAQKLTPLRDAIAAQFPGRPARVSANEEETLGGMLALALVVTGRAQTVAEATSLLQSPMTPSRISI